MLKITPWRPISSEYLVRPDSKISLNFYRDIYITNLYQYLKIKKKINLHLKNIFQIHN